MNQVYRRDVSSGYSMDPGWGASRALPAAGWRRVPNPAPIMLAGGSPARSLMVPNASDTGPTTVPLVSVQTPVDSAPGADGAGTTATPGDQSVMSFFSSLFASAFGSSPSSPASNAPVVIYGDASGGSAQPSISPIIIILVLAAVGYFGYKRFKK